MEAQAKTIEPTHVLIFPYPIQGHINPMLQFAKRLASKGLKITLVTTFTLAKSLPPQSQTGPIRIQPVHDGLEDGETITDHEVYYKTFEKTIPGSLSNLIGEYSETSHPVKFIIYDCIIPWVLDIAQTAGIDGAPFFTQLAAVNYIQYHVYEKALNSPVTGSLVSIPSLPLLRIDELPSLVVHPEHSPVLSRINIDQSLGFHKAKVILFNTFDKLEEQLLKWMRRNWPIMTVGPAIPSMYLDKRLEDDREYGLSMFKPESDVCTEWLDDKESDSVIYISMGSLATLGEQQMEEIANGLKHSDKHFLWIVRATEESKLPQNFKSEVAGKGLIVNWCPQLAILAHRAVGCFMTHCGWNSTLEAISLGVPLVAMPQWVDQPTNAKHIADIWKIGVRVKMDAKGTVTKDEIVACIHKVMEGETGREFKTNIRKLKELAKEAMEEGGSSDKNTEEIAAKILSM